MEINYKIFSFEASLSRKIRFENQKCIYMYKIFSQVFLCICINKLKT